MDLWQLKVFVNVVDHKSFSRAGDAIFLSQPTVSSHIKELEEHFGCRLIDRMGREALPTRAGELLYTYARKLLSLKDEAESAISAFIGHARGNLTFGGSTIPATYIIPGIIGAFNRQYPSISLSIMTGDTLEITTAIIEGEVEAGIVGAKVESPHLKQERLIEDEMKLIVPASHPWVKGEKTAAEMESGTEQATSASAEESPFEVELSRLFDEPFIGREKGSGTWESISRAMAHAGFNSDDLNVSARLGSNSAVIQGILNNAGISIVSTIAVRDYLDMGRLTAVAVKGVNLKRHFYLTTHKKRTLSPLAKLFINFLKSTKA